MNDSWVVVVDDDVLSLKNARNILIEQNIKVSCVKSGRELLAFMEKNDPDLILLDILMPEQDGFETYEKLREFEDREERNRTPVIFLTGNEDIESEQKGLEIGASDFIRTPFNKESLLWRIRNVVTKNKKIETLTEEATVDGLTGFLNKAATNKKMAELCKKETGILAVIDLDNFKLINDIYGHDMGDKVLSSFADIVRSNTRTEDILGRIGGDEFLIFCTHLAEESVIVSLTKRLNSQLKDKCILLMGSDFSIDIGVSAGCVMVSEKDNDYDSLFKLADKTLYHVKKNGKHSCSMYNSKLDEILRGEETLKNELAIITKIVDERDTSDGALWVDQDAFTWAYRFIIRYMKRNKDVATKLFFSVSTKESQDEAMIKDAIDRFGLILQKNIRKCDIMMQHKKNLFLVLLPGLADEDVDTIVERVINAWDEEEYKSKIRVEYIKEYMSFSEDDKI